MDIAVLGGSIAAVLALGGLARVLSLGGRDAIAPQAAMREAEDCLAGFDAVTAVVSRDGHSAVVEGREGFALVRGHGAHHVVRPVAAAQLHVEGDSLIVDVGESIFGRTTLDLGPTEAARWGARLGS